MNLAIDGALFSARPIIAFTGGREYEINTTGRQFLTALVENVKPQTFLLGGCRGVDKSIEVFAKWKWPDLVVEVMEADWDTYGKAAGPKRNARMVNLCDILVAFPGGRGTRNAISCALNNDRVILIKLSDKFVGWASLGGFSNAQ